MAITLKLGDSRLKEHLRKADRMKQAEFARKLGVERQFITQIINRTRTFSLEQAINAANILGCDVNDLYHTYEINRSE